MENNYEINGVSVKFFISCVDIDNAKCIRVTAYTPQDTKYGIVLLGYSLPSGASYESLYKFNDDKDLVRCISNMKEKLAQREKEDELVEKLSKLL